MRAPKYTALTPLLACLLLSFVTAIQSTKAQKPVSMESAIPKTWDQAALATLEVPLAEPKSMYLVSQRWIITFNDRNHLSSANPL
jgi:hypothetical protein